MLSLLIWYLIISVLCLIISYVFLTIAKKRMIEYGMKTWDDFTGWTKFAYEVRGTLIYFAPVFNIIATLCSIYYGLSTKEHLLEFANELKKWHESELPDKTVF